MIRGGMGAVAEGAVLVGRYELRERIGQGGTAILYRAFDTRLDRMVAVKLLDTCDRQMAEAAVREARLAAGLSHPHLVAI